MRNQKREIECLQRLNSLTPVFEEITQWLLLDFLISPEEVKTFRNSPETIKMLYHKLLELNSSRVLQLFEMEWSLLPVELIKISLVTQRGQKEISYGA